MTSVHERPMAVTLARARPALRGYARTLAAQLVCPDAALCGVLAGLVFALAARLPYLARSDFPLNDGGLFVAMSRDLLAAHFRLPAFTSYNADGIPFAYPPLSFYLVAAVSALAHVDAIQQARYLPLLANLGTVVGVAMLARSLLGRGWPAVFAPVIFALIARSYEWLIMGGGLTRSVGFLFATWCLVQARVVFARPAPGNALVCAVLAGLALASHLELGIFALFSLGLLAVVGQRSWRAVLLSLATGVGAVVVVAPWWLTVIRLHGLGPFDAASATGGWTSIREEIAALQDFVTPPRFLLSLPGALAALGALLCLVRGELFVPLWLPLTFIVVPRSAPSEATIPLALLAAVGLSEVVVPGVVRAVRLGRRSWLAASLGELGRRAARWRGAWLPAVGLVALLAVGVAMSWPRLSGDQQTLDSLSVGDRAAMAWVAEHTDASSQFLVLSPTWSWEEDRVGEWFPVLAGRRSLLTPQGAEWLPAHMHARRVCLFLDVRSLGGMGQGVDVLDTWASDRGVDYSYIYVSQAGPIGVDWSSVLGSGRESAEYTVAYDADNVTILQRQAIVAPRWGTSGELQVASDCETLADQSPAVQADFQALYGPGAAQAWIAEHERTLPASGLCARLGRLGLFRSSC